jgi:hypothetical protein
MIVKILSSGKSFSGLGTYLTHDPKAKTDERVAWTHTLNLAHDDPRSAVDSMLWTSRNAELLKQEAGIRAGGRALENPVKHLSLNWAPDESPTREHMIETTEGFLRHMNWQEHQALLVAHEDKAHAHVHVMLNVIHPETGVKLDDSFERRRAQAWALDYEREQGRIYCEQRLLDPAEREDAPTRPAWMAFKNSEIKFEREEKSLENQNPVLIERDIPGNPHDSEWKILKEIQRAERREFFADGKSAFSELRNSIYREIREEFRERWSDFYAAQKSGGDSHELAALKAELVAEQKRALEERRDVACRELRETRNGLYRELLDDQRELRLGLRERQEAGFENSLFLEKAGDGNPGRDMALEFGKAADMAFVPREGLRAPDVESDALNGWAKGENARMKSGADVGARIGEAVGFGLISFLSSVADGVAGSAAAPPPRRAESEPSDPNPFAAVVEDARNRQREEKNPDDDEWYKRQQRSHGE